MRYTSLPLRHCFQSRVYRSHDTDRESRSLESGAVYRIPDCIGSSARHRSDSMSAGRTERPMRAAAMLLMTVAAGATCWELVLAQPNPAMVGRWALDLTKSMFDPGPPLKGMTRTYQIVGDGLKMTNEVVLANSVTRIEVAT